MDPITFLALLAGGLAGAGAVSEVRYRKEQNKPIVLRQVWRSGPGEDGTWEANELLSEAALREVGVIFDLNLLSWYPKISSGFYRAVVIANVGGGMGQHVVVLVQRQGSFWKLDVAYRKSNEKATDIQLDQVDDMIDALNQRAALGPVLPGDIIVRRWTDGWGVVRLTTPQSYWLHGEEMQHGLASWMDKLLATGRELYAYKLVAPTEQGGESVATFVVEQQPDGFWQVVNSAGPQNRDVSAHASLRIDKFMAGLNRGEAPLGPSPTQPRLITDEPLRQDPYFVPMTPEVPVEIQAGFEE